MGRGAWAIGLGSALEPRASRGEEGACGRHLSPREQRAAGVCLLGLHPPVFCGAPLRVVGVGRHRCAPRQPPLPLLPPHCAVWGWGWEVGGWRRRCVAPPLLSWRWQRAPWPLGQTLWACCPRLASSLERCRWGWGAGERGLRWTVCGAATERFAAVIPSLHLSTKLLLAVGAGGSRRLRANRC